jgi:hypothetical protein
MILLKKLVLQEDCMAKKIPFIGIIPLTFSNNFGIVFFYRIDKNRREILK